MVKKIYKNDWNNNYYATHFPRLIYRATSATPRPKARLSSLFFKELHRMPITFNPDFYSYIKNQELAQLARLYRIHRQDGRVLRCTDWKLPIIAQVETPFKVFETEIFSPVQSLNTSALNSENRLSVDNLDLSSYFNIPNISKEDIYARRYHNAIIQIYFVSPELDNTSTPVYQRLRGEVGEITELSIDTFKLEFRSLTQLLQQKIGYTVEQSCNWSLGDVRCKVNLGAYKHLGTITSVTHKRQFAVNFNRDFENDYFGGGYIEYQNDGKNGALKMEVQGSLPNGTNQTEIILSYPMPFDPLVGEELIGVAGCRKTVEACKNKYQNILNHGAFPHLPGKDRLLKGAG